MFNAGFVYFQPILSTQDTARAGKYYRSIPQICDRVLNPSSLANGKSMLTKLGIWALSQSKPDRCRLRTFHSLNPEGAISRVLFACEAFFACHQITRAVMKQSCSLKWSFCRLRRFDTCGNSRATFKLSRN